MRYILLVGLPVLPSVKSSNDTLPALSRGGANDGLILQAPLFMTIGDRSMRNLVKRFMQAESGATAIEYGLIVALIAVFIIGAVTAVGTSLSSQFNVVATSL